MIGQLRGKIIEKTPPHLLIDVGGVGYCLQAPLSTFFNLPEIGLETTLRVHMVVREDAQLLYGFATPEECRLFQEIIKINGVGPKVGLAILSGLSPLEFVDIISREEIGRLQKLPGIGAKTAQRILVEMQGRLSKLALPFAKGLTFSSPDIASMTTDKARHEAIEALISLGYKPQEATKAVSKVQNVENRCEDIIKEALQGLAKV